MTTGNGLPAISIKRPVFAFVLNLLVIITGLIAFERLPLREYPDIDPPIVSVETDYIGASAQIIESRVTQVIEDSISGVEGIKTIDSSSEDGRSRITIEFALDRDIDAAANDVRDRVSRVMDNLPDEVDPPEISKQDADASQVFWISFNSKSRNALELTDFVDRTIRDRISILPGVARVIIGGERRYAMRIWLDKDAMAARRITVIDVQNALLNENVELPAGRIESLNQEFSVRVERGYKTAEDFGKMVISRGDDGYLVRMGDIARVEVGPENERTSLLANRENAVGIGISKQSKANSLAVAREIRAEIEKIRPTLPADISMNVAFDQALFIQASIDEVFFTLGLTVLLVVFVIWLFLGDLRATLIPAFTIPVSIMGAFIFLWMMGFTLNLLTLLALVLAIGLVVDDAIIVLENIYKRIEAGETPLAAAYHGVGQVQFAVLATTIVLISVFLPISFMPGDAGKLFTEFAWAIIGAIAVSGFTALSATPMMASKLLKQHGQSTAHKKKGPTLTDRITGFLQNLEVPYRAGVTAVIARPRLMTLVVILTGVLGAGLTQFIPSEYAPVEDRGFIFVVMVAPEGSSLEYSKNNMNKVAEQMGTLLAPDNGGPADGTGEAHRIINLVPRSFSATGTVNGGIAIALLKEWGTRRYAGEITQELFGRFSQIPGVAAFPIMPPSLGQNVRQTPVQFVIGGDNYEDLTKWRDILLEKARQNPKLVNLDWDYKEGKPQIRIVVDRDRAAELGVPMVQVGETLQAFFGSRNITTYMDRGEEYEVVLQGDYADRLTPADMNNIYVRSQRTNSLIPLSNLVSIKETAEAGALNRFNRLRAITISASMTPGYTLGEALKYFEDAAADLLPGTATVDYKGESREFKETGNSVYFIFALALVTVFLVLAAQFESFISPFVIMLAVPFALIGALWGLYLAGSSINIYTQVGLIMLVGLAAKNGILIVEFANQLRDQGRGILEATIEASVQRLRPIMMTSIATVAGAVPLMLAHGAGSESRFPLGVVIVSGVSFSTFLTLFIIPCFYAYFARFTVSPEATTRALERDLEQSAQTHNQSGR